MYFGAAWYPEHWPESRWPQDMRLMRDAGMNVCRVAEFAWSTLEPSEGQYALDWLDRAIALLHDNGMPVVLGTPTAAPPAWLTSNYPDVVQIEQTGRPAQHGNRCHYAPGSDTYRHFCRAIAAEMAQRFGSDKRVIGWQIDNEYSRVDYSDNSRRLFQEYLKAQYHTLDALNAHWSTAYWSQTYSEWEQIPLPIGPHNPGLMLAFRRFATRLWRDFQQVQIDAIRQHSRPEQWITHNFMGWFDGFDHYELSANLDMASWDWYVGTGHHDPALSAPIHDLTRGFKRRAFWIMETQPGSVNWSPNNNALNKGEARCMAFHAIGHGADGLLYWQWRSAPGGQEQLHGSLLGADGNPRPFYDEAAQIGRDLALVADALRDTVVMSDVAVLHSYDSRWSINAQRHNKAFDPVAHLTAYAGGLSALNVPTDIISPDAPLHGYKLVILPALVVLPDAAVQSLTAFVHGGGTLVLTPRCAQKDIHNALFPALQPGPLRELAGVEVADYYALDENVPVHTPWSGDTASQCQQWAELLRPLDSEAEIVARWGASNGWLDDKPAITQRFVGANGGQVIYNGAYFVEDDQARFLLWMLDTARVVDYLYPTPASVTITRRTHPGDGHSVIIVINHARRAASLRLTAPLTSPARDLLTGEEFTADISLPPQAVRVFTQ